MLGEIVPRIDVGSHGPNIIVDVQSSHGEHVIEVLTGKGVFCGHPSSRLMEVLAMPMYSCFGPICGQPT